MSHLLITGASSGLGAALALAYAKTDCRLTLHGRDVAWLTSVAAQARALGAEVTTACGDVTDTAAMKIWIGSVDTKHPIDLVIANAGISAGTGHGEESPEQSRSIFDVNLTGVLNTIHPILPLMKSRGDGQIAIVSSLAGFRGIAGAPSYCASKAAVRVYGEPLRGHMAAHGVKVNVVCPGFITTPMTARNRFPMPFIMSAERASRIIQKGLNTNRPRIAFPWMMYLAVRLLDALPQSLVDRLMASTPRKQSLTGDMG